MRCFRWKQGAKNCCGRSENLVRHDGEELGKVIASTDKPSLSYSEGERLAPCQLTFFLCSRRLMNSARIEPSQRG